MSKASPHADSAPPRLLWILGWRQDLLLFVATPLLILPVIWGASSRWSGQEVFVVVAAFGALGHHLPGMMRAYGDRALFTRFPVRFILAPIFLIGVCALFKHHGLVGVRLVVTLWGVWHGLMQTYGFLRIYDAKVGSFNKRTARLDFAMCVAWFVAADFSSAEHMSKYLILFYQCGVPYIAVPLLDAVRILVLSTTGIITVLFAVNAWRASTRGAAPNPVKLVLMGITFTYWWFCRVHVGDVVVGIALFEVFHDVQYLSIVWIFNRNRADNDANVGSFTRFVFGRSGALIGVYVGLVFAYGYLQIFSDGLATHGVKDAFGGVLVASTLLHFYYDGFIWKVRERSTSQSLGLKGGRAEAAASSGLSRWLRHGLKWLIFVVPLTLLGVGEAASRRSGIEKTEAVVRAVPDSSAARVSFAEVLMQEGREDEAQVHFQEALRLRPVYAKAQRGLGRIHEGQGNLAAARQAYEQALRDNPRHVLSHTSLGSLANKQGDVQAARSHYARALELDDGEQVTQHNMGELLLRLEEFDAAEVHLREAIRINPTFPQFRFTLGSLALQLGRLSEARNHFTQVLQLDPEDANAHHNMAVSFAREGLLPRAIEHLREAIRLRPEEAQFRAALAHLETIMKEATAAKEGEAPAPPANELP